MERTMVDLLSVWRHANARRGGAKGALSEAAQELLGQLSLPWPTEVAVLVSEVPLEAVMHEVKPKTAEVAAFTSTPFFIGSVSP